MYIAVWSLHPYPAKLNNLNFQPHEVVSPQLQMAENYWYLFNSTPKLCKYLYLNTHFNPNNSDLIGLIKRVKNNFSRDQQAKGLLSTNKKIWRRYWHWMYWIDTVLFCIIKAHITINTYCWDPWPLVIFTGLGLVSTSSRAAASIGLQFFFISDTGRLFGLQYVPTMFPAIYLVQYI